MANNTTNVFLNVAQRTAGASQGYEDVEYKIPSNQILYTREGHTTENGFRYPYIRGYKSYRQGDREYGDGRGTSVIAFNDKSGVKEVGINLSMDKLNRVMESLKDGSPVDLKPYTGRGFLPPHLTEDGEVEGTYHLAEPSVMIRCQ